MDRGLTLGQREEIRSMSIPTKEVGKMTSNMVLECASTIKTFTSGIGNKASDTGKELYSSSQGIDTQGCGSRTRCMGLENCSQVTGSSLRASSTTISNMGTES